MGNTVTADSISIFILILSRLEMTLMNITVVMGTRTYSNVNMERKQVQKIIIHHDYKPPNIDSDLALLLLATPVNFTKFKMPICLQEKERIWDRCWMTEWVSVYEYGMCLPWDTCRRPPFRLPWAGQLDALGVGRPSSELHLDHLC